MRASPSVRLGFGAAALAGLVLLPACANGDGGTTTSQPEATTTTSIATTTTTLPRWDPPQVCDSCPPDVIHAIPVGPEGITYLHLDVEEIEPVGPAGMIAFEDGWAVLDVGGLGIVTIRSGQTSRLELGWEGIQGLIDLAISSEGFWVLDFPLSGVARLVNFAPDRGALELVDLPQQLQLDSGLSGLANGPTGELWVELEGGQRVATFDPASGAVETYQGYPYPQGAYYGIYDMSDRESMTFHTPMADVVIDGQQGSLVAARLLGINQDRSFVLEITEVTQDEDFVFVVDLTAHWYAEDGTLLGVTTLPLREQLVYVSFASVVGADGHIYYLLTGRESVEILRLHWHQP